MPRVTRIVNGKLVDIDPDNRKWKQGSPSSAEYYRREQKTKFRRELAQRVDPREFSKAYPEKAREYYGDENFRKYTT
jgi:hypothetical protein